MVASTSYLRTLLSMRLASSFASSYNLNEYPTLKYGTAWKKDRTAELVTKAIKAGFRHIDTACQPRHYHEAGTGEGWNAAAKELGLTRTDIWLQTKFSGLNAHDPNNIPYDVNASLEDRVRQSLKKSLENLNTDYIDSLIMHGPEDSWDDHWKVWRTMETAVDEGKVRQLGISNFYRLEDVVYAYDQARIKPKVVQNRFYSQSGHDVEIREFCRQHDIEYQSFWTLTGNPDAFNHQAAQELAKQKKLSPEALFYSFCMTIGISPMDGTTNEEHMREAVQLMDRIRSGEKIFTSKEELNIIGNALGTPGWNTEESSDTSGLCFETNIS